MEENLSWDEVEDQIETITDTDVADAESMGKLPVGKFLCTCIESIPVQRNFNSYSCIAANLKFSIDKVLEINEQSVKPDEFEHLEGRFIWDSVNLYHPDEKDGMRKRRILIAKRFDLIGNGGNNVSNEMWANGTLNRQVILETELNKWTDEKTGAIRSNTRVKFNGYEAVAVANVQKVSTNNNSVGVKTDDFSDI